MSPDISQRIRSYAAQIENDATHVTVAEIEAMIDSDDVAAAVATQSAPSTTARWNVRPVWVAVSAAAVVALVFLVPLLFIGSGEPIEVVEPATTMPTATTVPATTVPIATTVPGVPAEPMTWERISDPAQFGGDYGQRRMTDVARGNGVVVAVGSDRSGGDMDAAVWYSFDGRTWTRAPHDEAVFGGGGHQQINGVAAVGSGFVAVGSEGDDPYPLSLTYEPNEPSESFETHAAVWRSDDGITWSRVPHADAFSGADGGVVINDVAYDGTRLVAVGSEYHQVEPFAVWGWEPDPRLNPDTGLPLDDGGPNEIDTDVDAAVWRSDDGVSWTRVDNEGDVFGGDTMRHNMNAVVAGGPGFVAVGIEGFDYTGLAYLPSRGSDTQMSDLQDVTDNTAAVWTSPDGVVWTRVAGDASLSHSGDDVAGWATMVDIVATDAGLVAVGRDSWYPTPSLGWSQFAAVWRSVDGSSWHRTDEPGELGSAHMQSITDTGDGRLVAVGLWYDPMNGNNAYMWSSHDNGDTWARIWGDDERVFGGFPDGREEAEAFGPAAIHAVTSLGGDAIAVGYMGGDAAVWTGSWNSGGG